MYKTASGFCKHTLSCATGYRDWFSFVDVICAAWELVVIFLVAVVHVCCWLCRVWRKYEEPNLWGFWNIYVLFGDLQIMSFLVPFGNFSLFYGDV